MACISFDDNQDGGFKGEGGDVTVTGDRCEEGGGGCTRHLKEA